MQLLPHQNNVNALRDLAREALNLLAAGQFGLVADRYGYARAFGRGFVDAVAADLAQALLDASGSELLTINSSELTVVFYQDNSTGLRSAVDCEVPSRGGRSVLISFVVTETEDGQFFVLEDIYGEPAPEKCSQLRRLARQLKVRFGSTRP
jgi:hypothetical protein